MADMHIRIVTVEKVILDERIKSLICKNEGGEFQILPNHSPFITTTVPSKTRIIMENGKRIEMFTSTGVMKVLNNDIIFITDASEYKEDIDENRAREAKKRAEKYLDTKENIDIARAKLALMRADARIETLS